MNAAGGSPARWGTAAVLALATLVLSVASALPLVLAPLAALLLAVPPRRWQFLLAGAVLWVATVFATGGPLGEVNRGWAVMVAGAFLLATLLRPQWSLTARALATVLGSVVGAAAWLAASARWPALDGALREHFRAVAQATLAQLQAGAPESAWTTQFAAAAETVARAQWTLFPAMLALQTLAALGLAWWLFCRFRRPEERWSELRPLRDFRFHDQLVWLVIGGVVLVLLPLGAVALRVGWNLLFFMGGLYVLRGLAVFAFLTAGTPPLLLLLLALFAGLFLYPLVLTAALLVGLGDTWLDVRGRVALATRS